MQAEKRYPDLVIFCAAKRIRKMDLANELGVSPGYVTQLLYPERYRVQPAEEMLAKIATLLNQPIDRVRRMYQGAA